MDIDERIETDKQTVAEFERTLVTELTGKYHSYSVRDYHVPVAGVNRLVEVDGVAIIITPLGYKVGGEFHTFKGVRNMLAHDRTNLWEIYYNGVPLAVVEGSFESLVSELPNSERLTFKPSYVNPVLNGLGISTIQPYVVIDGDEQHRFEDINAMIEFLDSQSDEFRLLSVARADNSGRWYEDSKSINILYDL